METVLEILGKCEKYFAEKGVPNPKTDAQLLLADALGCKRLDLFLRFDQPMDKAALDKFREAVRRRAKREPLQHILGSVEFCGLKLKCDSRALVPRHETEELCSIIIEKHLPHYPENIKILDLGTGSGAIILALKSARPQSECTAADKHPDALALAAENAQALGQEVAFKLSDWFQAIKGCCDIIVSNPPYLTNVEMESAQPEVRQYDPATALYSPDNGLSDLRQIISRAHLHLNVGGLLALECGAGQPSVLKAQFEGMPEYSSIETAADLSGRERFLFLKRA